MRLVLGTLMVTLSFLETYSEQVLSSYPEARMTLRVAVLTFEDQAGFQGKWELGRGGRGFDPG